MGNKGMMTVEASVVVPIILIIVVAEFFFGLFLVLLFTVRFIVESVKESQGGFESALGLFSTGQWLSIPFILIGLYFVFRAEKETTN